MSSAEGTMRLVSVLFLSWVKSHCASNATLSSFWRVGVFAGSNEPGSTNADGGRSKFNGPSGIAFMSPQVGGGQPYALVSDTHNHAIRKVVVFDASFVSSRSHIVAGNSEEAGHNDGDGGVGTTAKFKTPEGISISPDLDFALIADRGNHMIRRLSLHGKGAVSTLAGHPDAKSGSSDGRGSKASFDSVRSL